MKRLAGNDEIDKFLDRISKSIDNLNDIYYIFINNLNELYKSYPEVYNEINQTIKLPTKEDVEYISSLKEDFKNIKEHLNNDNYLDIINK